MAKSKPLLIFTAFNMLFSICIELSEFSVMLVFITAFCFSLVFGIFYYMPRNIKLGYTNKETLVTVYFHQVTLKCSHTGRIVLIEGSFTERIYLLLTIMSKVIESLPVLSMRSST